MTGSIVLLAAAIVLPDSPTAVERSAADELRAAVVRMTGEELPVVAEREAVPGTNFLVGATREARRLVPPEAWKPDEILVGPVGSSVVLTGHPTRGPLYSVDVYLEDVCGVRWWTSTEADYPKLSELPRPSALLRHAPPFAYRETYYLDGFDPVFKVRSKGNFSSRTRYMFHPLRYVPRERGGDHRLYFFEGRGSAYHSFFETLPPKVHFAAHPDWYSEIGGRRVAKQLCLTNEEMTRAYVEETLRRLRTEPDVDFISVSQNDWDGACQCEKCRAVIAEEGETSGLYLRFANRVAEAVEREFPSVRIDTFAYRFTRRPPKRTRPRHNVAVRLCDIECAFNAPIATSGLDDDFLRDLKAWGKIAAGRLFVWDYTTDFVSYMMPHPNVSSLGENVRLFARSGAVGVFEQGDALCSAGSFAALEHWMLAHLLWNPDRDATRLRDEFIRGYYGPSAAPHVRRCREIVDGAGLAAARRGVKVGCYHLTVTNFMDKATALDAAAAIDRAVDAARVDGACHVRRVLREKLSFDHMKLVCWKDWELPGSRVDAIRRWISDCRSFGVEAWREDVRREDLETYFEMMRGL